jgi:UDP-2-acetamido-3-amino-2,3-dideoxy-glucuronate N-acetyltransferase
MCRSIPNKGVKVSTFVASSAIISSDAFIGEGAKIWHHVQIRENVKIGKNCVISKSVYIDAGVTILDNVKIQNHASIYAPAYIESGVFIGPNVVLTNDKNPRATNEKGQSKSERDWDKQGVIVREGASLGAGSICVAPVEIGRWAMVGAGSVVVQNLTAFGLYVGVPAKRIGWVGKSGVKLSMLENGLFNCPISNIEYREIDGVLIEVMDT